MGGGEGQSKDSRGKYIAGEHYNNPDDATGDTEIRMGQIRMAFDSIIHHINCTHEQFKKNLRLVGLTGLDGPKAD